MAQIGWPHGLTKAHGLPDHSPDLKSTAELLSKHEREGSREYAKLADSYFFPVSSILPLSDETNPPANGARHGFVSLAITKIGSSPPLHLLAGSWAAVGKWNHWREFNSRCWVVETSAPS